MKHAGFLLLLLLARSASAQDHILCNTNPLEPVTISSGAPFSIDWLMEDTLPENGLPNRYNGFYVQIDDGSKIDIGLPSAFPACSETSKQPGDIPFTYKMQSGVSRGFHILKLSAWNFALDSNGNPTQVKEESIVTQVPFNAGDSILFGPPAAPIRATIHR